MTEPITIAPATPADEADLSRLAALDSRRVPASPTLLARVDGQILAAVSAVDGSTIADPFRSTDEIVRLLLLAAGKTNPISRAA